MHPDEAPRPPADDAKWTPFKIAIVVIALLVMLVLLFGDFEK